MLKDAIFSLGLTFVFAIVAATCGSPVLSVVCFGLAVGFAISCYEYSIDEEES